MSYPTAPGYEAYAAAVGQSYPLGNQGYHTPGMQQQMPSQAYTSIQNALQAAVLEAQQQQQQQYAMANQNYYQNATAAAYQAAAALQQEQQQKLFEQQLQQQLQLQQQYARQAQMYQNYPTQAYVMPYTSYVSYQQVPGFPASRSYGAAQTGYPPNGTTGYSASWPVASTSTGDRQSRSPWAAYQPAAGSWVSRYVSPQNADAGRRNYYYSSRYPSGNSYHSGYGVPNVPGPSGYRAQSYGYPRSGAHPAPSRHPQGR
ncbi:uncharacterized protein LOC119161247 [Rhipicephalus microplus]|uniref:uncharacterized protein LOC119161247 n=1 Tax=Rhipicephalus microplus TaxID=6941 RepID=UPI003F6BD875